MKTKKCLALLLVLSIVICVSSISASASAKSTNGTIHVMYEQTSDVQNGLDVSGNSLYVYAATFGYSDATKCGVTATLQKLSGSSWVNYHVWTVKSTPDYPDSAILDTSIAVSSGKYRLASSHSVTVGSNTELEGMMSPVRTVS